MGALQAFEFGLAGRAQVDPIRTVDGLPHRVADEYLAAGSLPRYPRGHRDVAPEQVVPASD